MAHGLSSWNYALLETFPGLYAATFSAHPTLPPQGFHKLLYPTQVHGDRIHEISDPHADLPPCDAIATSLPGIALMIRHADCQAALIYDPETQVIAAVHAGWRGLVQEIYPKTLGFLEQRFGSRPKDLRIAISPSLGPENAEFIHYRDEFPPSFWKHQSSSQHFDLRAIAQEQLHQAGILPHHLEISPVNTFSPKNGCPSYRRDRTTDRMGSIIGLRTC